MLRRLRQVEKISKDSEGQSHKARRFSASQMDVRIRKDNSHPMGNLSKEVRKPEEKGTEATDEPSQLPGLRRVRDLDECCSCPQVWTIAVVIVHGNTAKCRA